MGLRVENWNGHRIRFVEKEPGEWWAVLSDVAKALDLGQTAPIRRRLPRDVISSHRVETIGGAQAMLIVNEFGIYETVFESRKPEAKAFKRWVYEMLRTLRKVSGLEGFEIFRMLDKEHQKSAMARLHGALPEPSRVDFIKANTIANKTVSTIYGYPKMIHKNAMTPEMLLKREEVLDDTVELMESVEKFGLGLSVSQAVRRRHLQ
ncbi:BRO-N domain-containing protein [Alicyclobacillus sp. ALC3]|uniref:BRO-N domain-containing protein n=1 Tax=Alicyclobacillus sp. ALC3 TaxID=2796143 RepID=UPI00237880B4|nr:BRO family protein [Alicyclobacillus sp. ALC3]WDL96900.1 phage repressor protein [Alicyclobacillus sp. ALC3]